MSIIEYFQESINLFRRKSLRSWLAVFCITLGVFSIMIVLTVFTSTMRYIDDEFSKLDGESIVIANNSTSMEINENLSAEDKESLCQIIPEIKSIQAVSSSAGYVIRESTIREANIYGVEKQYIQFNSIDMLKGRFINGVDVYYKNNTIVISDTLAQKLFQNINCIGEKIKLKNNVGTSTDFEIVGIYDNQIINDEQSSGVILADDIFIPLTTLQEFVNTSIIGYFQFKINGGDEELLKKISNKAVSILELRHNVQDCFFASNSIQAKRQYTNIIKIITSIFTIFGAISIILGGMNLANILLISIKERYKEIGIRKAVGATKLHILVQFMFESMILTIMGGILGSILGFKIGKYILSYLKIESMFNIRILFFAVGFNILISIIFGIYPAYRAAKLNPVNAFRID